MRFKQLHSPVLQRKNLAYLRELNEKSFEQEWKTIDDALDKLREIIIRKFLHYTPRILVILEALSKVDS